MTRILKLQTLRVDTHPMIFDAALMSGISSICPQTNQPGYRLFEME